MVRQRLAQLEKLSEKLSADQKQQQLLHVSKRAAAETKEGAVRVRLLQADAPPSTTVVTVPDASVQTPNSVLATAMRALMPEGFNRGSNIHVIDEDGQLLGPNKLHKTLAQLGFRRKESLHAILMRDSPPVSGFGTRRSVKCGRFLPALPLSHPNEHATVLSGVLYVMAKRLSPDQKDRVLSRIAEAGGGGPALRALHSLLRLGDDMPSDAHAAALALELLHLTRSLLGDDDVTVASVPLLIASILGDDSPSKLHGNEIFRRVSIVCASKSGPNAGKRLIDPVRLEGGHTVYSRRSLQPALVSGQITEADIQPALFHKRLVERLPVSVDDDGDCDEVHVLCGKARRIIPTPLAEKSVEELRDVLSRFSVLLAISPLQLKQPNAEKPALTWGTRDQIVIVESSSAAIDSCGADGKLNVWDPTDDVTYEVDPDLLAQQQNNWKRERLYDPYAYVTEKVEVREATVVVLDRSKSMAETVFGQIHVEAGQIDEYDAVYVKDVPLSASASAAREALHQHGLPPPIAMKLFTDLETNKPKGSMMMRFSSPEDARRVNESSWGFGNKKVRTRPYVELSDKKKKQKACSELSRLDCVKMLFTQFATCASTVYNVRPALGLTTFGSTISVESDLTELVEDFNLSLEGVSPKGNTAMWDAALSSLKALEAYRHENDSVEHLRLLVLSDGDDTCSNATCEDVLRMALKVGAIVDAVIIGSAESQELASIVLATGGALHFPRTMKSAIHFFENEVLVSLTSRAQATKMTLKDAKRIAAQARYGQLEREPVLKRMNTDGRTRTPEAVLRDVLEGASPAPTTLSPRAVRRIQRELAAWYQASFPYVDVMLDEKDVGLWRIIIEGPPGTPYERGAFIVQCRFSAEYPTTPPHIRFETPIKHLNINRHGLVCHELLGSAWSSSITMYQVFAQLYALLESPQLDSSPEQNLLVEYRADPRAFAMSAARITRNHSVPRYVARKLLTGTGAAEADMMASNEPERTSLAAEVINRSFLADEQDTIEHAASFYDRSDDEAASEDDNDDDSEEYYDCQSYDT